ncbi:LIM domaincontaining protein [Entamoeba marina]
MECSGCHQTFRELNAGLDQQQWCDQCFNYKTCAKCHHPITRNNRVFKTNGNDDYHIECFRCCACSDRIRKAPIVFEGKLYCSDCGVLCPECKTPIGKEYVVLQEDVKYHVDCVKCYKCHRTIADEQIFEVDEGFACAICVDS